MSLLTKVAAPLFLSVFIAPVATAQQWSIPRFSDDVKPLISLAAQPNQRPETDVVVLDDEESYVFDSDGRAIHTRYVIYKILTQKGVDNWDNVGVTWEPWHEERPTLRARVIAADQSVHNLDPSTVTDSPAKDDEDKAYGDRRVVRAPLPAIAPGAIVEEEDRVREAPVISGAGIVRRAYFGRGVPVERSHLELDAPASLSLQYSQALLPDVKPQRTETAGRARVTFDSGPMEPLEDAPPNMPSDIAAYPEITFSTGKSWVQLADAYDKIVNDRIAGADLKPLVVKLTSGKQSRDDKMQTILQYLSREIRYTGVEFDEAAIVPRSPAEVLTRRYGDCKDKSVLLVAMLRAAGIPAYVALLDAGEREDVPATLPGTGLFDHAIVFVPGAPDIWIDATDQYARPGELATMDQGRYALVARAGNDSLQRIPAASAQENLLIEKREIHLAENGPANIVEISQPHGALESVYREDYGDKQNKDVKESLTKYVKNAYLADKLDAIERSDPDDLSKPFELRLICDHAKRGATDLSTAVVAVRLEGIFDRLPSELQNRDSDENTNPDTGGEKKKKRTADFQLPAAFTTEWQYEIVPPLGFQPKPLPKDTEISLGPALLSEQFSSDKDNIVHATIRFEITRTRLSAADGLEMRDHIAQMKDGEPILVYFEPVAQALLNQGKAREAFQSYRDLIAAHPKSAIYHLQKAEALLSGGLGDAARQEARLAVTLEPNSALAQKTLADVLEYDTVGRKFRPGSDYDGAIAAFRAAQKLDPDDKAIAGNLAILFEYNKEGVRYGPDAKLKDAIAEYRSLTPDQLADLGLKNNLPFALFYAGEFSAARKAAEGLNPQPISLIVACEAVAKGSQAGLAEAHRRESADSDFRQVAATAGQMLMNLRKYPLAADLLDSSASGANAAHTVALASMLRKAQRHEDVHYPNDPSGLVMQFFLIAADSGFSLPKMAPLLSRSALVVTQRTDPDELKNQDRQLRTTFSRSGLSPEVGLDILMTMLQPSVEGSDQTGYRAKLQIPGAQNLTMFVVKETGAYKLLDAATDPNSVGLQILDRVDANDLVGARTFLDWVRDEQHLTGGDDPLSSKAFPRIWTKGRDSDPLHMRLAAAAILVQTKPTAEQGVKLLASLQSSLQSEEDRLNCSLALVEGYAMLHEHEKRYAIASQLYSQHPDSLQMYFDVSFELRMLGRFDEADGLAKDRLKRTPDDIGPLRELVYSAIEREHYDDARKLIQQIVQAGKANAFDLNNRAWYALFTGRISDADVDDAVKASQLSPNSPAILHTLGCLYAEIGKTKEAREVLVQAMDLLNLDEPNSAYRFAFGRLAEQYGERDAATADYNKVDKPKDAVDVPGSTYGLAQLRLKALATEPENAHAAAGGSTR